MSSRSRRPFRTTRRAIFVAVFRRTPTRPGWPLCSAFAMRVRIGRGSSPFVTSTRRRTPRLTRYSDGAKGDQRLRRPFKLRSSPHWISLRKKRSRAWSQRWPPNIPLHRTSLSPFMAIGAIQTAGPELCRKRPPSFGTGRRPIRWAARYSSRGGRQQARRRTSFRLRFTPTPDSPRSAPSRASKVRGSSKRFKPGEIIRSGFICHSRRNQLRQDSHALRLRTSRGIYRLGAHHL